MARLSGSVFHFAYFYALWMTIQFALKAPSLYADSTPSEILAAYAWGLVDPYATLWFIYLLAVFFLVVKVLHWAPRRHLLGERRSGKPHCGNRLYSAR